MYEVIVGENVKSDDDGGLKIVWDLTVKCVGSWNYIPLQKFVFKAFHLKMVSAPLLDVI